MTHGKKGDLSYIKNACFLDNIVYLSCNRCKDKIDAKSGLGRSKTRATGEWNENTIDNLYTLTEKYERSSGRCYEFVIYKKLTKLGITHIKLVSQEHRTHVAIHSLPWAVSHFTL